MSTPSRRRHDPPPRRAEAVGTEAAAPLASSRPRARFRRGAGLPLACPSNGASGGDVVSPVRPKALDLLAPGLRLETLVDAGALRARVTAEALAFFVTLEADRPGRFSDNALAPLPGRDAEITFTPADGDPDAVTLTIRDLFSSFTADPEGAPMTDFASQLYSARNFPPLSDTLKMLKAAGYTAVEGYGALYADDAEVAELTDNSTRAGLRCPPAISASTCWRTSPGRARDRQGARHQDDLLPLSAARPAPDGAGWRAFGERLQEAAQAVSARPGSVSAGTTTTSSS